MDDRQTPVENREKALKLIEAWGESTEELRYLPIFEETYKVLTLAIPNFCVCFFLFLVFW